MRKYTAEYVITSLSTAKTLLLGQAPSTMVIIILNVTVKDLNTPTVEQWEVSVNRVTTRGSPTGTSISAGNVQKGSKGDGNTSVTWLADLTAEPTTYDANPLDHDGVPNTPGYRYEPSLEDRPEISPSESFGIRMIGTPAATKVRVSVSYLELGG